MLVSIVTNDIIKMEILTKYLPSDFEWNLGEKVTMNDISSAIENGQTEGEKIHDPNVTMPNKYHIGRIIYFINHPEKIEYIKIQNSDDGYSVRPIPVMIEGYHRFMAAYWLYLGGKLKEIYCSYEGRKDLLNYLKGNGRKPSKLIEKEKTKPKDICIYYIENNMKEYYYELYNGELIFGDDIKKAKKFSEVVAKDMMNMFRQMSSNNEYRVVKEKDYF